MIKLIATDVDGTLVKDGTMQIDPEYMTVIKELVQKGIIFAVCSGRQFISERKLFAPIKDQLLYITDGGKLCLVLPCRGEERRTHFLTGRFVVDGELDDILLRDVG